MTDIDWMVLQSFPSMFIKNTKNRKIIEDYSSNITTSASVLPSETIVSESSEQSPVLSAATSILASENNTRLPGYREETEIAKVKQEPIDNISDISNNEPLSLDQSLPELKRHQKPIILSDKTEVLKMNQQLQTAAVSPNCSKFKDNKKRSLSYRPNPKFYRQTASWMSKPKQAEIGVPVAKINEPVVKLVDKMEAYQLFLNTLAKFSQCKPKPACTVYTPQNIVLDHVPVTEGIDNTPDTNIPETNTPETNTPKTKTPETNTPEFDAPEAKTPTPETIDLFSDSNSDSDGSILNFAALRQIAARKTKAKAMRSETFPSARKIIENISKRRGKAKRIGVYNRRLPRIAVKQRCLPEMGETDKGISSVSVSTNLPKSRGRPPKGSQNFIPAKKISPSDNGKIASSSKSHFAKRSSSSAEDSGSDWSSHYKTVFKEKIYPRNLRSEKNEKKQTPSEVVNLVITAPILDKPITMEINLTDTPSANDIGGRALLSNPDLLTGKNLKVGELLSKSSPITYKNLKPIMKCRKKTRFALFIPEDSIVDVTSMDSQNKTTSIDHTDLQKATSNVNSHLEAATSSVPTPTDASKIDLRSYYSMMADSLDFSNLDDGDFDFGDLEDGEILDSENSTVVPVSINQAEHMLDADEDSSYILPEPADSIQAVKRLHETIINVSDSEDEIPLAKFTKRSKK